MAVRLTTQTIAWMRAGDAEDARADRLDYEEILHCEVATVAFGGRQLLVLVVRARDGRALRFGLADAAAASRVMEILGGRGVRFAREDARGPSA